MAEQVALTAETRPGTGKSEARSLRREGRVPAVAYGSGLDSTPVHVDSLDLLHALTTDAGENVVLRLQIDGATHLAMPREVHRHPVRREVLHVDFVTLDKDRPVVVEVPLVVHGHVEAAVVSQPRSGINVRVLPLEVPDEVTADVTGLEIGDVIRIGDIELPASAELVDDPEMTAVSITTVDIAPVEEPEEEEAVEGEEAEEVEGAEVVDEGEETGEE